MDTFLEFEGSRKKKIFTVAVGIGLFGVGRLNSQRNLFGKKKIGQKLENHILVCFFDFLDKLGEMTVFACPIVDEVVDDFDAFFLEFDHLV